MAIPPGAAEGKKWWGSEVGVWGLGPQWGPGASSLVRGL